MRSLQWITILQPLVVIVIPLILSQLKRGLGGRATWLIPASAPVLGALADFLQSFLTHMALGPTQAALLGALGVWLREVVDQLRKAAG